MIFFLQLLGAYLLLCGLWALLVILVFSCMPEHYQGPDDGVMYLSVAALPLMPIAWIWSLVHKSRSKR